MSAVADRGGIRSVRCLEAKGTVNDVIIDVDIGTTEQPKVWGYRLAFRPSKKRDAFPVIQSEEIRKNGELIEHRNIDSDDELTFSQTLIQQASTNVKFRELVEFLASVRRRGQRLT